MGNLVNIANLKKTWYYFRRNGIRAAVHAAGERLFQKYEKEYVYSVPEERELEAQRAACGEAGIRFSILVPAYETKEAHLRQMVDSVLAQTYPHWELLIADGGKSSHVEEVAGSYTDSRIRYFRLPENAGISRNTNAALKRASGDYVGLLDHDDFLTPEALFQVVQCLEQGRRQGREYLLIYSDEDKCDETGKQFYEPHRKTEFNLDLFLTNNYICHFLVMRRELMDGLQFRSTYDGAQDYDICLRAVGECMDRGEQPEERIAHIPRVLYHWRCHRGSTAANPRSKAYAYEAGRKALEEFLKQRGWQGSVSHTAHVGFYHIDYENGIFAQRKDIAAVGGKAVDRKGRILPCIYDEEGYPLYAGLPASYAGYLNRAVLAQNAAALSMEYWEVNPGLQSEISAFLKEIETLRKADTSESEKDFEDRKEMSRKLCRRLREEGYRLYWDPGRVIYCRGEEGK
ncbi:MAG: glycosyltransferase [Lachnospiraceae bacterium]|nr:glycosyltransferase [Lachnospiraceae bacterium]